MSSAPDRHDQEHVELMFLHALRALPSSEAARAARQVATCAECAREMESLRPIIDTFVSWPAEVLRPPAALWDRLAQRIGADTSGTPAAPSPPQWTEPDWKDVAPGISCKVLATDTERQRVTMLVRLAPDTEYPPHRHAGVEELHLLHGELMIGDRKLSPGDYNRAEPDTEDYRVWSETGCTCVLITSLQDVIL